MEEIVELLCWGGFSAARSRREQSALVEDAHRCAARPGVQISEDYAGGVAPPFQAEGFARPPSVPLVDRRPSCRSARLRRARRANSASTRTARTAPNRPSRCRSAGGTVAMRDALAALDTGLAVGNLWYLNYSDRPACRMTGMTRFATFWVENGKVVAPVDVLRFDDTRVPDARRQPRSADDRARVAARIQHVRLADADERDASGRTRFRDEFHALTKRVAERRAKR